MMHTFVDEVMHASIRASDLAGMQWARDNACSWGQETCRVAARGGHLVALKWLLEHGCPCGDDLGALGEAAAEHGHLHVVQWLHARNTDYVGLPAFQLAASAGHMHVLIWLSLVIFTEADEFDDAELWFNASQTGQLHVLKWLHQRSAFSLERVQECFELTSDAEVKAWLLAVAREIVSGL